MVNNAKMLQNAAMLVKYCQVSTGMCWSRQIFDSGCFRAVHYVNFLYTDKPTCICVHYWSAVVYKAEAAVKFSELPIILTYLIFYLAIKQYFPSVAVVFGANLSLK